MKAMATSEWLASGVSSIHQVKHSDVSSTAGVAAQGSKLGLHPQHCMGGPGVTRIKQASRLVMIVTHGEEVL
jgi:hypothetical protein